jgi:hypothetical protein
MATNPGPPDEPGEGFGFQDEPARPVPPAKPKKRRPKEPGKARTAAPGPATSKPRATVVQWVSLAAVMVPLLAVAIFMAVRQNRQWSDLLAAHRAEVAAYLAPGKPAPPGAPRPKIVHVVAVDVDKRALDEGMLFSLPESLRAETPADVTTVLQNRYTAKEHGRFEGGGRALQLTVAVTVIDRATGTVLGTGTFTGPPPPKTVSRGAFGEDVNGGLPVEEVVAFLKRLEQGP